MIIALCILVYLIIGWIIGSVFLAKSMRNNNKTDLSEDFVLPFCFWPFAIIGFIIEIIILFGRIMEKVILNLPKREKMKLNDAFDTSNTCKKYEYDESGFGRTFGRCCATCAKSNRKTCPKKKGSK